MGANENRVSYLKPSCTSKKLIHGSIPHCYPSFTGNLLLISALSNSDTLVPKTARLFLCRTLTRCFTSLFKVCREVKNF